MLVKIILNIKTRTSDPLIILVLIVGCLEFDFIFKDLANYFDICF